MLLLVFLPTSRINCGNLKSEGERILPLTPKGGQRVVFQTMRKRIGYNTNSHPLQGFVVEEIICD